MGNELTRIVAMAELLRSQQADLAAAEQAVKEAKAAMLTTERETLPLLMTELGLTEIKLKDGAVVSVKEDVDVKIPEARRSEAMDWLVKNGFGGIVKTEVSKQFGAGEMNEAVTLYETIGDGAKLASTVHHSTLKSFVREQLAQGTNIPYDMFGIFPYSVAIIKENKK